MSSYIGEELRRIVAERADRLCEYCLIHERDSFFGCEVDHVISLKHGGSTELENLAYACAFCNRHKGSDIGSIFRGDVIVEAAVRYEIVRFFNPRIDRWSDHFRLSGASIMPLTEIGEVTVRILGFNNSERLLERQALLAAGSYPSEPAATRMMF